MVITPAQLGYLLEGIDWKMPQKTWGQHRQDEQKHWNGGLEYDSILPDTGRIWTYVRDDRPFGGQSPPPALYYASRDRRQEHPERHLKTFTGILQVDAYGGYNPLFKVDCDPGPLTQALLVAREAQVLRAGRHRHECQARQPRRADLAYRAGNPSNRSMRCSTSSVRSTG
ncbi:hypothetical protein J2W92_005925 [Rhizobium leguminosarum]